MTNKKYRFDICYVAEYHAWITLEANDELVVVDPDKEELERWAEGQILKLSPALAKELDMPELMQIEHVTDCRLEGEE